MKRSLIDAALILIPTLIIWLVLTTQCRSQTTDPARASYRVWVNSGGGRSGGSATGISPHLVVTNAHVVGGAEEAEVSHPQLGKKWGGQVVSRDPASDVALIYVQCGELEWVNVASGPQPQMQCRLYGYGSDSILKCGTGAFVGTSGYRRGTNVPVWDAAVSSVSGDSGGGLFNSAGELVAINWGGDPFTNASASTSARYILSNAQRWATDLVSRKPEFTQLFAGGGCWGECPPQYGGGGGYGIPPKQPIQVQPPSQPQAPLTPIQPAKPAEPAIDLDKLAEAIAAKIPKPKDGEPGKDGLPGKDGKDGVSPTADEIAAAVAANLKFGIVFLDAAGQPTGQQWIKPGESFQVPAVWMRIRDGSEIFDQRKPLGASINIDVEGLLRAADVATEVR